MPFHVTVEFHDEKEANEFVNDLEEYREITFGEAMDTTVVADFVSMVEVEKSVLEDIDVV